MQANDESLMPAAAEVVLQYAALLSLRLQPGHCLHGL